MKKSNSSSSSSLGFTIVELLVVIVVIGILAAITIVSYSGITAKANIASLQSDLTNNSKKLKMYYTLYGHYPTIDPGTKCPITLDVDDNYCLKASSGNVLTYTSVAPITFHLNATKNNASYSITSNSSPAVATATTANPTVGLACPAGFIAVPGSGTYGTNDFCVMKYEAKNVGGVATSQPALTPWVSINQTDAITTSTAACTGCHLITEAEWMTIAQNVLSVNTNWSNNTIGGANYIYSGHNNNIPTGAQVANPSDANGYAGTNSAPNQRRTLTLTNGEVIWDMAGNVWDWTSGTVQSPIIQPGIAGAGYNWREWNAATTAGTLAVNPFPSYGTPAASNWNAGTNGIGRVYSSSDQTVLLGFIRGGDLFNGDNAGVSSLNLAYVPISTGTNIGFRVSR